MDALRATENYKAFVSAVSTIGADLDNEAETTAALLYHFMKIMADEHREATTARKRTLKRQMRKCAEVCLLLLCEDEKEAGNVVGKLLTD